MNKKIKFITTAAIIAAAYVVLTLVSAAFNLAYGPVQFRLSEALCILAALTPAAIPGLTVGCIISNLLSFNAIDMLFGSAATLIAAILTYYTRKITFKDLPLLGSLFPVVVNGLIVGAEIAVFFLPETAFFTGFAISALQVALGEMVICYGLGIPLYGMVKKTNLF